MKYLPFENLNYKTKRDPEEISKRLAQITEPCKTFRIKGFNRNNNNKPYEGVVNELSFSITRIIDYRNGFLPQIKGKIKKDVDGTIINVKMTLNPVAIAFSLFWFIAVTFGCLISISSFSIIHFEPMTLIPFGMLLFGYALVTGGFKYESRKSKKYLAELFEGDPEE